MINCQGWQGTLALPVLNPCLYLNLTSIVSLAGDGMILNPRTFKCWKGYWSRVFIFLCLISRLFAPDPVESCQAVVSFDCLYKSALYCSLLHTRCFAHALQAEGIAFNLIRKRNIKQYILF